MNTRRKAGPPVPGRSGADYIALVGLSLKVAQTEDRVQFARAADPGDTCERVPETSLAVLLAHDPPQIILAEVWEQLSTQRRAWLFQMVAENRPWGRHASTVPGWINPDLPEHAWLVEHGLVPKG